MSRSFCSEGICSLSDSLLPKSIRTPGVWGNKGWLVILLANLRLTTLIDELLIASEGSSAGLNEQDEVFLDFIAFLEL